jgi:hypothetical protein
MDLRRAEPSAPGRARVPSVEGPSDLSRKGPSPDEDLWNCLQAGGRWREHGLNPWAEPARPRRDHFTEQQPGQSPRAITAPSSLAPN